MEEKRKEEEIRFKQELLQSIAKEILLNPKFVEKLTEALVESKLKVNDILVNKPTIVELDDNKAELEITKEKLVTAKLTLETALAFIIHDNLRKLIESTLKDINSK